MPANMKKLLIILLLLPSFASAQVVFKTNQLLSSTTPYMGVVTGNGVGTSTLQASSTPTAAAFFATSTSIASLFNKLSFSTTTDGCVQAGGGVVYVTGTNCATASSISGANNMVISANASGTLIGTSTPSFSHILATSTTATSTFAGVVEALRLNVTSTTATSTFANGIDITGGCYRKQGACVTEILSSLTGILEEVGGVVGTVTIGTGLNYTGTTLSLVTPVAIANGGTNASSFGTTNGVTYYDGTRLVNDADLTFTNGNLLTATYASSTALTISGSLYNTFLTSGRVPYTTTGGLLTDASTLTYDGTSLSVGSNVVLSGTGTSTIEKLDVNSLEIGTVGYSYVAFSAPSFIATSTTVSSTFAYPPTFTTLTSAIVLTGAGGLTAEYTGASCTNQFIRSLDALGASTCATVGAGDVSLANLTATDSTLTFSGTYNGSTARTIGLNLGNANTFTALQTFSGNASTTQLTVTGSTYLATASGNVGIGTTSPNSQLALSKASGSQSAIMLESGATGLSLGYQDIGSGRGAISNINNSGTTNNLLSLGFGAITAGVPANPVITLNQSGNVGIGTTSPDSLFAVSSTVTGNTADFSNSGASTIRVNSGASSNVQIQFEQAGVDRGYLTYYNTGGYLNLCRTGATTSCGLTVDATDQVLMSGNVGIGTTSPYGLLSVEQGTEAASFWVGNTGSTTPSLWINGVNGNGRVGIGSSTPVSQLSIKGGVTVEPNFVNSSSMAIDWNESTNFATSTNANKTVTFLNVRVGQAIRVGLTNTTGSALTFTWPAAVTWGDTGAPTADAISGGTDIFTFWSATGTDTIHGRFAD